MTLAWVMIGTSRTNRATNKNHNAGGHAAAHVVNS